MKRYQFIFIFTLFFSGRGFAQTELLKPYQQGDWKAIAQFGDGAPLVIHFWGVTCPACVKELPQWGMFVKNNPTAKIVFVQVDDVSQDAIKKMLIKANLNKANNYYVVGSFDERLRYEIDPQWHGETPTTIIINKSGKATRQTGLVNFQKLQSTFSEKS